MSKLPIIKKKKFNFVEHISVDNPSSDIIEQIMAIENEQERLAEGIRKYSFQNHISASFMNLSNIKIKDTDIGILNNMALEYEKNKKRLKAILNDYINQVETQKIYNWRFLDVAKSYSDCVPYKLENDEKTKHLTEDDLVEYVNNSEPRNTLTYELFLGRNDKHPIAYKERERRAKSSIAIAV